MKLRDLCWGVEIDSEMVFRKSGVTHIYMELDEDYEEFSVVIVAKGCGDDAKASLEMGSEEEAKRFYQDLLKILSKEV